MKVEYKFAPETKDFLLLPALDEWHDLYLHSDLPVQYVESDEEGMYLKTSEDCRGSVFLNTEDGKLSLNCAMSARSMGNMRDMVLVIKHKGLRELHVNSSSDVTLQGDLTLQKIHLIKESRLSMRGASIRTPEFLIGMSDRSVCELESVKTGLLRILMMTESRLVAHLLNVSGSIHAETHASSSVQLDGTAHEIAAITFDSSALNAIQLKVPTFHSYAFGHSSIICQSPVVSMYVAPDATFQNMALEAEHIWNDKTALFQPLRKVDTADALQICQHLRPYEGDDKRVLTVYGGRFFTGRTIDMGIRLCTKMEQGKVIIVNQKDRNPVDKIFLRHYFGMNKAEGEIYIHVALEDVDWTEIPLVKRRFLKKIPELFEVCL